MKLYCKICKKDLVIKYIFLPNYPCPNFLKSENDDDLSISNSEIIQTL